MQDIFLIGHRPPVLLLHGLRGNPLEIQLLAQRLHRAGHTVSAPYLSGYGQRPGDCAPFLPSEQRESLASKRLAALVPVVAAPASMPNCAATATQAMPATTRVRIRQASNGRWSLHCRTPV